MNCKKKNRDEEKRMLQLLKMHADWLSNRGLCKKQQKCEEIKENNKTLIRTNQQVFLMLFWSIYPRLSTVRDFME